MTNFIIILIQILSVFIASSVHEFAHALIADKLGDNTPRYNNRLTLNPIAHVDPIGALSLFLFRFGWSKPVPINPNNFQNPIWGTALVSIAGPTSNILLAVLSSLFIRVFPQFSYLVISFIIINCALALFNLIPIAPLDGFKFVTGILPLKLRLKWENLEKYGPILLVLLILPYSPISGIFTNYMRNGLDLIVNTILF
jgi:Zn-dependent protease